MIRIVKKEGFDEEKENIYKAMEINPGVEKAAKSLMFPVGKKLSLEIEVTDEYLSSVLYDLLHNSTSIEGANNLGFKVLSLGTNAVSKDRILEEIDSLKEKVINGTL